MKKLAILSIAFCVSAFANNDIVVNPPAPIKTAAPLTTTASRLWRNSNVLSFGPDVFWQGFGKTEKLKKIKSNGVFGGARLRYEYVKPAAIYAGTDGLFAIGGVKEVPTIDSIKTELKRTSLAANVEQRLGYTFAMSYSSTLAPFAGLGWYYTRPFANNDFSNDFVYAVAGLKLSSQVSSAFNLGLIGKGLYSFYSRTQVKGAPSYSWDDTAWGFEVDLPLTWNLNLPRTWSVSLEPYIQDLDVSNHFINAGGRFLACYQF